MQFYNVRSKIFVLNIELKLIREGSCMSDRVKKNIENSYIKNNGKKCVFCNGNMASLVNYKLKEALNLNKIILNYTYLLVLSHLYSYL